MDRIEEWIKKQLDAGYSIEEIKNSLRNHGYDPKIADRVISNLDRELSERGKVEREIMKEVEQEVEEGKVEETSKYLPLVGIVIGVVGIFLFTPFNVFLGMAALFIAKKSIDAGYKKLGKIADVFGILSMISFLFQTGFLLSGFI